MPIIFHALKHHLVSLKQFIVLHENEPIKPILPQIKSLGESTFDMYVGSLSNEEIIEETTQYLKNKQLFEAKLYQQWITLNNGFSTFELSDKTLMTLRYLPKESYIHLHPCRYAQQTIRIRANAMKTAMALRLLMDNPTSVENINKARMLVELSPIKPNANISEIIKCYELIM